MFSAGLQRFCTTNPSADILWSSLYLVGNLWQDQDASHRNRIGSTDRVGSTGGHWETVTGSYLVPFGSGLGFQVSMRPFFHKFFVQVMKKISFSQVWWLWSNIIFILTLSLMIWWSQVYFNWKFGLNDPKKFDDPRYSIILVIRWTLIIQSLRWYLHLRWSCLLCCYIQDNKYQ